MNWPATLLMEGGVTLVNFCIVTSNKPLLVLLWQMGADLTKPVTGPGTMP